MARGIGLSIDEIKMLIGIAGDIVDFGVNGYLGMSLFGFATVGCAKLFMKICTNEPTPKYSRILTFLSIGLLTSSLFKIFNFEFLYKSPGFGIVLIINIILYVIIRQINKPKKHIGNYYSK